MRSLRLLALLVALSPALVLPSVAEARHARHGKKAVHHAHKRKHGHKHKHKHKHRSKPKRKAAPRKPRATPTAASSATAISTVPILQPLSPDTPTSTTALLTATVTPAPATTPTAPAAPPAAPAPPVPSTATIAPAPAVTPPAPTAVPAPTTRVFAADSFWNAPLPDDAPLDDQSSTYVTELETMVTTSLPWVNTTSSSEPVYTVGADQPMVEVTLEKAAPLDKSSQALADSWKAVPIPDDAVPAAGTDKNLVVYQPSTDTLWEFWQAVKQADGWHAKWGGTMHDVSTNSGRYSGANPRWGASATSLPVMGGLMRTSEIQSGHIDHALAISLPQTRAKVYSWPAQRTDGNIDSTTAIPEGTRFRLPPDLDLSKIPMSRVVREMAVAAQKYGIVVRDRSASVAFYGEDPTPTASTVWNLVFGGKYPSVLLAQFPWSRLEALKTQLAVDPI